MGAALPSQTLSLPLSSHLPCVLCNAGAFMTAQGNCPFCILPLELRDGAEVVCPNGHVFDAEGLSLATNMAAARALWLAVHAMEDDAAGLSWRAERTGGNAQASVALLVEATAARTAAGSLRVLALAAQRRLDGLAYPTSVVRLEERRPRT